MFVFTRRSAAVLSCACSIMLSVKSAQAVDTFVVGQKVEVREGDTWSPASVLAHEGRKYQVHYQGGDPAPDEWVLPDRIRIAGSTAGGPAATATPTEVKPANEDRPDPTADFSVNEKIEAKWGGLWRKAVIIRKGNGWTMVQYDKVWYEWVQPWRVRKIGSDTDTTLDSQPRPYVEKDAAPPQQWPDAPASTDTPKPTGRLPHSRSPRSVRSTDPAAVKPADADPFHISDTTGPNDIPITKPELAGHDVDPSEVVKATGPDPAPSCPPPRMLSLNHGTPAFGVTTHLIVNPQGKYAMLSFTPMQGDDPIGIQRVELSRSDAHPVVRLSPKVLPLAISPDGSRAITRSEKFFPETKWRLDLWNVDTESPKPLLSFRPYDVAANGSDAVLWAAYVDANHLMTCSAAYTLTLWQTSDTSFKELYTLQGDGTVHPQMSSGGKYVIVGLGGQVLICDALTGACVAKSPGLIDTDGMVASLSSDLSHLALAGSHRLVICDLVNQKLLTDMALPEAVVGHSVNYIAANLLLIDDRWIFDTEHHAMVWEYTIPAGPLVPQTSWVGNRLWFLAESGTAFQAGAGKLVFTSVALLDAKVLAAQKQTADAEFIVKPGSSISLEVNVDCSAEDRQKLIEHLTKRATAAGLVVADGQSVKLVAEKKSIDSRQVTYHDNSFNRTGDETVTVSDTEQRLSIVADSKTLWTVSSTTHGSAPFMVMHAKDKSIAQTLDEQNKPTISWYLSIGIPHSVTKPADATGSSPLGIISGRSRPGRPG